MNYLSIVFVYLTITACARDDSKSPTDLRRTEQANGSGSVKLPDRTLPNSPGSGSEKASSPTSTPSDNTSSPDKVVVDPTGTIAKVVMNKGQAQRSRLTTIDVYFNTKLNIDGSVFDLIRQGEAPVPIGKINVTLSEVNSTTVASLAFSGLYTNNGSLNEGLWKLTVNSAKVNAAGGKMTGDYEMFTYCLFGDVSGEKNVDSKGYSELMFARGSKAGSLNYVPYLDYKQAGTVSAADFAAFNLRTFDFSLKPKFIDFNAASTLGNYAYLIQRSKIKFLQIILPYSVNPIAIKSGFELKNASGNLVDITVEATPIDSGDLNNSSEGKSTQVRISFAPTWRDFSSIKDGTYTLNFNLSSIQINGLVLKQSIDTETFKRLFGDTNGDGIVTLADPFSSGVCPPSNLNCQGMDFNDDGVVDVIDGREYDKRITR